MDLVGRVHAFAARHGLWAADTPVVAAVSGGADSVALLFILHELAQRGLVRLAGVAHLNHCIRGDAADEDAAFVQGLADRLALPLAIANEDVPAMARRIGQSLEVAGRQARLAFFERVAADPSAPRVALAHTRTDQAETVLLRITRGAGPRGLAGIAPRVGHRVRPLLEESREALRAWLLGRGESWREDATNADTKLARNQVRLEVMPRLSRINPAAEAAIARAARIQASDADLLDHLAAQAAARLLWREGTRVHVAFGELKRLHEALARRVIRQAFLMAGGRRTPSWEDTEAVLRLSGTRLEVGGVRLELFGDSAVLTIKDHVQRGDVKFRLAVALTLQVPGSVRHPQGWWEVEAAGPVTATDAAPPAAAYDPNRAVVDAAAVGRHLKIRGWQPGDRVQPVGLGGRKKLQDVFVDRKVPRDARAQVPVVVDAQDRIVWVAGHVVGEPFRATPRSVDVVVLTLRR